MSGQRIFGVLALAAAIAACTNQSTLNEPEGPPVAPVLTGLGDWKHPVTARSVRAQQFFDQGLALTYGFNHEEAARAFREAQRLDQDCAMAYWGEALALAPNINDPLPDEEREQQAFDAIHKAKERAGRASAAERDYIYALAQRFSDAKGKDRLDLNRKYAAAMKEVAGRYPRDADAQILWVDAVMNTTPWNYWYGDGGPKEGIPEIIATVERVIRDFPNHAGAHHLYIHLVEASDSPDRALPSARVLGDLTPSAGHLVHMPAHIFIRTGLYGDAAESNVKAIAADDDYITQCRSQGLYPAAYHPHNWHFLWASATMEGRGAEALRAARELVNRLHVHKLREPGWSTLQYYKATPWFALVRFGKWDEILAEPAPEADLVFETGVRHYARGIAFMSKGQAAQSEGELRELRKVAANPEMADLSIWGMNSLKHLLDIAVEVLAGELAAKRNDFDRALMHLERAVRLEDGLMYNEPPDWHYPVRQSLGAVLLEAGRPGEAATVYWEDLRRNRENGWSLFGLAQALRAAGKPDEAAEVEQRFQKAWARADVKLPASRM
jgi:tetratricopeptide (TPR) repeat protein